MADPDLEEDPGGFQPLGIAAAASKLEDEAAAHEGPAEEGEPQHDQAGDGPGFEVPWFEAIDLALEAIFAGLHSKHPEAWDVSTDRRKPLSKAWARVAEALSFNPTPLTAAALCTVVVCLPEVAKNKRGPRHRRTVDVEAEEVPPPGDLGSE